MNKKDEIEVISLTLNKLGLKTTFSETLLVNEKKSGRKITAFPVKGRVSEFWHKNCSPSTITLWLAKVKTDSKAKY